MALACYVSYFRYIMSEQKKADDFGITEDDVSEIRQDINKFRFELVDILSRNNFDIGKVGGKRKFPEIFCHQNDALKVRTGDGCYGGRRAKQMERRIMKVF